MGHPTVELPKSAKTGLSVRLSDLVGQGSLYMFDRMGFNQEWLHQPINQWSDFDSFQEMKKFVTNLLVCNDPAERGIKLISDYANSLTKNEEDRQQLLQVVEWHRKMYPDTKKSTLSKSCT